MTTSTEYDFDSSDEEDIRNTAGNIPIQWYSSFGHVGYDTHGRPIMNPNIGDGGADAIDEFLVSTNTGVEEDQKWRTIRDPQTGQLVVLSEKDLDMVSKIASGHGVLGEGDGEKFEPWNDWFSKDVMQMPVTAHPPQKRSFIPSLLDKRRVGRMVHAIKQGWIKPQLPSWALSDTNDKDSLRRYAAYLTSGNAGVLDSDDEDDVGFPSNAVSSYVFPDVWEDQQKDRNAPSESSEPWKSGLPMLLQDYRPPRPRPYQRAARENLPGHNASYNPPPEFLLSKDEKRKLLKTWREQVADGYASRVPPVLPQKFDCLRHVSFSETFLRERGERVKDLVMAARIEKQRLATTPEEMLPPIPSFSQLRPYPSHAGLLYRGHDGRVTSLSMSPCGQWLASISPADGCLKIWEASTNYCFRSYALVKAVPKSVKPIDQSAGKRKKGKQAVVVDGAAEANLDDDMDEEADWSVDRPTALVSWNPNPDLTLVAAAIGKTIYVINPCLGDCLKVAQTDTQLAQWWNDRQSSKSEKSDEASEAKKARFDEEAAKSNEVSQGLESLVDWKLRPTPPPVAKQPVSSKNIELRRFEITTDQPVISIDWHVKGDYLVSLSRPIRSDRVRSRDCRRLLLHRMSTASSQTPFAASNRLSEWRQVAFHPTQPRLFVAAVRQLHLFDLIQQQELRCLRLDSTSDSISCIAVHPSGEHVVTGTHDSRFNWFDVDLGNIPFKKLKLSHGAIRHASVHRRRPLVSVAMDDGTLLIIHATVSDDLLSKPTIIPVQLIRTGQPSGATTVFSTSFHPHQPHVYSGGEDGSVRQFVAWQ